MASRTPVQVTNDILAKLAVTAPGLSMEIGTPERKIVEAVAEAIAEVQIDNYLVDSQLNIDSKSGKDLEDFVGIFGFGRLQGHYASGVVTVSLSTPAVTSILIPVNTQFSTNPADNSAPISFSSTVSVTISAGQSTADIPVSCSTVGTAGNVSSGAVSTYSAGIGIANVTNSSAMTGGTDDESDEELRARFKATLLRNIAGTEDFYVSVSRQVSGVNRVNVIGPASKYVTQVESTGGSIDIPSKNCKYVWPNSILVATNKGSAEEQWFTEGDDYDVTGSGAVTAPQLDVSASIIISPATSIFLDVLYEYCSTNSRNDPGSGIFNKVDVFVDGQTPITVTEAVVASAVTLNNTVGSPYLYTNFGSPTGDTISTTSKFQRLGSVPIASWPAQITGGSTTYVLGTDYFGVYGTTTDAGSERELAGIIWKTTPPTDNTILSATYTYNQTPSILGSLFRKTKQITTDVLVHSAVQKSLRFYFVVMYDTGASVQNTNAQIVTALQNYINNLPFGSWVQLSDLTAIVHNTTGVDNCRIAKTTDGAPYSAAELKNGSVVTSYTSDFQLDDDSIAVLDLPGDINSLFIRRSTNNFGS
jgi:uncharacterized phage protein gp47/JayE